MCPLPHFRQLLLMQKGWPSVARYFSRTDTHLNNNVNIFYFLNLRKPNKPSGSTFYNEGQSEKTSIRQRKTSHPRSALSTGTRESGLLLSSFSLHVLWFRQGHKVSLDEAVPSHFSLSSSNVMARRGS